MLFKIHQIIHIRYAYFTVCKLKKKVEKKRNSRENCIEMFVDGPYFKRARVHPEGTALALRG